MQLPVERILVCFATVCIISTAAFQPPTKPSPPPPPMPEHTGCQDERIPGSENKARVFQLLEEASRNLAGASWLQNLNKAMTDKLGAVYDYYYLFGYGKTQLYVREADSMLKGHHSTMHNYEHL